MAFKQKRTKQVRFIHAQDEAIDPDNSNWIKFFQEGCNIKHLTFLEDQKPTIFIIQRLNYDQRKTALDLEDNSIAQAEYIVRCGLRDIENMPVEDEDENVTGWINKVDLENGEYGKLVTVAWMRDADLPTNLIKEMALTIRLMSEGKYPLAKRSEARSGVGGSKSQDKEKISLAK